MNMARGTQSPHAHKEGIIQRLNSVLIAFSLLPWWAIQMAEVLFFLFCLNGKSHYGSYHCTENKTGDDGATERHSAGIWYLCAAERDTYWEGRWGGTFQTWVWFTRHRHSTYKSLWFSTAQTLSFIISKYWGMSQMYRKWLFEGLVWHFCTHFYVHRNTFDVAHIRSSHFKANLKLCWLVMLLNSQDQRLNDTPPKIKSTLELWVDLTLGYM